MSRFRKQAMLASAICLVLLASQSTYLAAQTDSVWIGGTGNWNVAENWNPSGIPSGTFNVFIDDGDVGNSAVTIPNSQTFLIDSLTIDVGDSLQINNNAGLIIQTDISRPASGMIFNDGDLFINNGNNLTDLQIDTDVSLTGAGTITLGGSGTASRILDSAGSSGTDGVLTNFNNLIQGKGQIGVNNLQVINGVNGDIVANDATGTLTLDPRGNDPMFNMGLMQAASGGNLVLTTGNYNNIGGIIEALALSTVTITGGASVTGGTLQSSGDGQLEVPSSQSVGLTSVTIDGTLNVRNNSDLSLAGTITNMGNTISILNGNNLTDIVVDLAVSLEGGGTLTLGGSGTTSRILDGVGSSGTDGVFTNVDNVIQGKGQIGVNNLQVINQSAGLIDANDAAGNTLTLDPRAADPMINLGTMQASGGGNLVVTGFGGGFVDNSGGLIEAEDASTVTLTTGASIVNGTLQTSGTGQFKVLASTTAGLTDVTIDGTLNILNNTDLFLAGTITNMGNTINILNGNNLTNIVVDTAVNLEGGGTLTLGGSGTTSRILDGVGSSGTDGVFTNVDNVIQGKGQIGVNNLQVINQATGLIDANDSSGGLTLDPRSTDPMINMGIMQASGGGNLIVTGFGNGFVDNSGGLIEALDASSVTLTSGASIVNGTVRTSGTGQFEILASTAAGLTDVTIDGTLNVLNNSDLFLDGTITNMGNTINILNAFNNTDIHIDTAVSLEGGGTVTLGGSGTTSRIVDEVGVSGSDGVLNNVDNLIQGKGQIGANSLQVINEAAGLIDANDPSGALTLDPRSADPMINLGTMQASGGGHLVVTGFGNGFVDNSGGLIEAQDASTVTLTVGGTVNGGTLQTSGSGTIQIPASTAAGMADLTIAGTVVQNNNSDLFFGGTIENQGSVNVVNAFNLTDLTINSSLVVTGPGSINLIGSSNTSRIEGSGDIEIVGGTLTGYGQVLVDSLLDGATVSPGSSIGTLQFTGTHTMVNNTQWDIELGAIVGTPGIDWDLINVTGTLDLDDDDLDSGILVKAITLDANGDPGELENFQVLSDYSWVIARGTTINAIEPSVFTYDLNEFANPFEGAFVTTRNGDDVVLNYLGGAVCLDGGSLVEGFGQLGAAADTCASDNVYWQAHGATLFFRVDDPVTQFEATATAPAAYAGGPFRVHVEGRKQNNNGNLNVRALLFNFVTQEYVALPGILSLSTTDLVKTYDLPGGSTPTDYVEPGTDKVKVLLQTIQTSGLPNVRTQLDQVLINFD